VKYGEYTIVEYSTKYKHQVIDLQRQLWSADGKSNLAYFEWKYEQNPLADEIPAVIALYNGQVVAFRGFFPQVWCIENGEEMKVFSPADLIVDSVHRRKGLFQGLTEASFSVFAGRGIRFFLNLSSNEKSSPGYLKLGWKPLLKRHYLVRYSWVGKVERLALWILRRKVLAPFALFLKRHISIIEASKTTPAASFKEPKCEYFNCNEGQVLDTVEYRFDEIDRLRKEQGGGKISHIHLKSYMDWRIRSPRCNYRFLYYYKSGVLCGYLILSRSPDRSKRFGHVVDYGVTGDGSIEPLLKFVLKKYKFRRLQWTVYGDERARRCLLKLGFEIHQELDVLIRPVCCPMSDEDWVCGDGSVVNEGRWDIRGICSDGI